MIATHIHLALWRQPAGAAGILEGLVLEIMADKDEATPIGGTRGIFWRASPAIFPTRQATTASLEFSRPISGPLF